MTQAKASGCDVEPSRHRFTNPEAFTSHDNAALKPRAHPRYAQLGAENTWTYSAAAKIFTAAPRTGGEWAEPMVRQIVGPGWRHRSAAAATAWPRLTGSPESRCDPYEPDQPAVLIIQVDVTKFGNIPDGGGHRLSLASKTSRISRPFTS